MDYHISMSHIARKEEPKVTDHGAFEASHVRHYSSPVQSSSTSNQCIKIELAVRDQDPPSRVTIVSFFAIHHTPPMDCGDCEKVEEEDGCFGNKREMMSFMCEAEDLGVEASLSFHFSVLLIYSSFPNPDQ